MSELKFGSIKEKQKYRSISTKNQITSNKQITIIRIQNFLKIGI